MKRFLAVMHARNLEFIRDRSALSWTLIMPFFLVFAFAFIFSDDNKSLYKVAYVGDQTQLDASEISFMDTQHLQVILYKNKEEALSKLQHHQIDMVFNERPEPIYWINASSPAGYMLERILWGSGGSDFNKQTVDGAEIRYVDWVLPGILSFNIMMGCLFGVGYVIVRYRKSGFLKRLKATPLSALEFLIAQMCSRLLLMLTITIFVFFGCDLFLNFTMLGSYLLLFLITLLGSICMISLGLLVAATISSEELAGGILNLITWPMMILSGVWFSLEGAHPFVQNVAQILPLTHLVDGARAIMTEGQGIADIYLNFIVLSVMSIVFLFLGAKIFRWE